MCGALGQAMVPSDAACRGWPDALPFSGTLELDFQTSLKPPVVGWCRLNPC